ncbi:MAG TPA: hypothetical protein VHY33_00515 [Thermoanaerobaculia bacterium]|jgi:hypothetical protein|nr:hypothetical protein [Thermoanaerobaculia bacterium]
MKSSVRIAVVLSLMTASALHAQQVVVGQINPIAEALFPSSVAGTLIDINNPANAAGVLTTAAVQWATTGTPCTATFRIRFFRELSAGTLNLVDERGPFSATTDGAMTFALTPPVSVHAGDLIGVAMFGDANCGVAAAQSVGNQTFLAVQGNFTGGSIQDASVRTLAVLSLRASSSDSVLVGVIPAVGSVQGANGAAFRTTFQSTNEGDSPMKVGYTYHPSKTAGASDLSTTLAIAPHATNSTDILSAMGVTGLGSVDVFSATWSPLVTAHVYNDTGNGTNGFIEPMISVREAIRDGGRFRLVIPTDTVNYRTNIGSRSLSSTAHVGCYLYDSAGQQIGNPILKDYPANYFEQVTLQEFIGATTAIPPAGNLDCQTFGDVIFYSSVTDNKTNDSAIYVARRR